MRRIAQWTNHIGDVFALVEVAQLNRRKANLLHHECDCTFRYVGIGNGERHTLAFVAYSYDNEVSGLSTFGNQWSLNVEAIHLFGELFFSNNLIHGLAIDVDCLC